MLADLKTNPMFIWSDIEIENQKKAPKTIYIWVYLYTNISRPFFLIVHRFLEEP